MKKKTNQKYEMPFYESAPIALLEKIAELNAALSKHRGIGQNTSALSFYEDVLRVMRLAHMYMEQTKFIHDRNNVLESNMRYLAQHSKELSERLEEYDTVARLKLEGRLDDVVDVVEQVVGGGDDNDQDSTGLE